MTTTINTLYYAFFSQLMQALFFYYFYFFQMVNLKQWFSRMKLVRSLQ